MGYYKKVKTSKIRILNLFVTLLLVTGFTLSLTAQTPAKRKAEAKKGDLQQTQIFPDKYSELDDVPTPAYTKDEFVLSTLEKSRQKYLQALILISNKDTLTAAKYFEQSIDILNVLASYPGIEQNQDFTDLVTSIVEDFEYYIHDLSKLDENSSFFILREKFYQEAEKVLTAETPVSTIQKNKDTATIKPSTISFQTMVPLDDNELVDKAIVFLAQNQGRKYYKKWLERSSRWFPMMKRIAAEEGVPQEIIYLSMTESGLDPNAVSRAQAVGLWQFIRSTGALYGLNTNSSVWIDERRDPEKATRAAVRHLRDLYNELGDWHLSLSAYNCGINCVNRAKTKTKIDKPTFWDIRNNLPKETRKYVPLYIAATKIMLQPEYYGFKRAELNFQPEYVYETIQVPGAISMKALAKCAGVSTEELALLNCELIKSCTPPDVTNYTLKIPVGTKNNFMNNFASLTEEEKQPWINHKVARGENLLTIAEKYNVSSRDLASINGLSSYKTKVKAGTVLRVPLSQQLPGSSEASSSEKQVPVTSKKLNTEGDNVTHTVVQGETLYSIAAQYGVRLADLRNLNNISYDDDKLDAGRELIIAKKKRSSEDNSTTTIAKLKNVKTVKHKVKKGETLAKIADNYNVSIEDIVGANRLKKKSIFTGQVLKIKVDGSKYTATERASTKETSSKSVVVHKVKAGESLGTIAAEYGVDEDLIKKWNKGKVTGNTVYKGSRLKIYTNQPDKGSSVASSKKINKLPKYYTIRKGETFGTVAKKFGVSVGSLKSKNPTIKSNKLAVGQKIRIQ
ncbi:MAG: Membrane-bound lytic murein transglycosylase [Ignavibacteria bacterium]|nr:Membrane-bound lytic murein transglycosylase [Ignavibacteria bacterium]